MKRIALLAVVVCLGLSVAAGHSAAAVTLTALHTFTGVETAQGRLPQTTAASRRTRLADSALSFARFNDCRSDNINSTKENPDEVHDLLE